MTTFLFDIVVLFGAALASTLVARWVRAPAIIGFLFAGMLIGPSGFAFVHESGVHDLAELGLVLLLFTVGLELSPTPLVQIGGRLLVATTLQTAGTAGLAFVVLYGVADLPFVPSLVLGLALSPASTAIVLKQLSDRGELDSAKGVVSTGVLLLQDVLMLVVLAALPLLAGPSESSISLLRYGIFAAIGVVGTAVVAKWVMPWTVRVVVRESGREAMTLFAVVTAVAGAWLASAAGWSPAFGAAVAGLVLAATDVRHQLFAEILPFRELFNALFFVSIGMLADLDAARSHVLALAAGVVAILIVKAAVAAAGVRIAGWPSRFAVTVGIGLSTVSEFGYVVANQAALGGIISSDWLGVMVQLSVGTMFVGAILVPVAPRLAQRSWRKNSPTHPGIGLSPSAAPEARRSADVVIVGYGLNGRNLSRVLTSTGITFSVVEMNPGLVRQAREAGARVIFGDAARRTILEHAGLADARAVVISINDMAATRRIVAQVRAARRDVYILARTRFLGELEMLHRLGADLVIPEEFETSIEIFSQVLAEFGIPDNVIEQQIGLIRAGHYSMLRGRPQDRAATQEWLRLLEVSATRTFLLSSNSPFVGKTIRETELRATTGVTIVALTRGGQPLANPAPDTRLEANDVLVLVGTHGQIETAKRRLTPSEYPV